MTVAKVEVALLREIDKWGSIHLSLLDPATTSLSEAVPVAHDIEKAGCAAVMVGGSTVADTELLDDFIRTVKENTSLSVILFPNNVAGLSREADAVWFMSLLNSRNPYYITGAQMLGAPIISRLGLEALPMGYLIVGEGGSAGLVGDANVLPYDRPDLASAYALAASLLGMRFIYLEAGSGAKTHVPPEFIASVREAILGKILVVGGGIKQGADAYSVAKAGADIVVTGTLVEDSSLRRQRLSQIAESVKQGAADRKAT
ncbi:MAG: geranylgeranylglyceryl/heptaprenylglyceryl phosphate synthase [Candidatus Geothermarchaeales archaeon]